MKNNAALIKRGRRLNSSLMTLLLPIEVIERALITIADANGYELVKVSAESMAESKGESRLEDEELIRSGKLSPEQVQDKNDACGGNIKVRDWSPIFA